MNLLKRIIICFFLFCLSFDVKGQDDLLSMLDEEEPEQTVYSKAAFKTTRVINNQSIENVGAGVLDFKISHRFGFLNSGAYNLFGLDAATIRIGLDYGITDNLMVGFGRSSFEKTYDFFGKFRLLRQSTGKKEMPVTVSLYSNIAINTLKFQDTSRVNYFTSRLYYAHQVIIGRKFNDRLTLQLMPTMIHKNLVATINDKNDIYAMGVAGRVRLTRRLALNAEYFYAPGKDDSQFENSLSIGFDIETGGHVFQLHFTNSTAMVERGFVTETTGDWLNGDIHFGFNISRVFNIRNKKK